MNQDRIESILALDCGSTTTQALLIDRVAGEFRLVARAEATSTVEPPWNDVSISARQAIGQLAEITGWPLLDEEGHVIVPQQQGDGVDAVAVITSASEPLRILLAGLISTISLESAHRALRAAYTLVEGEVSLDRREDGARALNDGLQAQVQLIRQLRPDAVVIVGGVDGGATRPVLRSTEAISLSCSTLPSADCPPIIYAGNAELRPRVAAMVGGALELRAIDNVRPSLEIENPAPLQDEIEGLYRARKMERVPGFGNLASWSTVQVLPAARALVHSIRYLAELDGINVLGVDVGGASVTAAAVVDQELELVVRSDLGLSYNAARTLERVPVDMIQRWLPYEAEPGEVVDMLHNKALHYRTVPETRQELLIEQAVAREILRLALADIEGQWQQAPSCLYPGLLPKFHLITGGGGVLANVPHYGQAALILLDALQPVGVTGLALDRTRLLAPLGVVGMVNPAAAAQVMERDTLLNLGTVVAPVGPGREGDPVLTFKIEYEDGRFLEVEVLHGSLEVIPLAAGQTANLELRPSRRFDVGLGTRGLAGTTKVEGGVLGIIIDARGRPLPIAADPAEQQEKMQRWLWDMGS
jgi:uncharacterized protein (TIGR01319 family)